MGQARIRISCKSCINLYASSTSTRYTHTHTHILMCMSISYVLSKHFIISIYVYCNGSTMLATLFQSAFWMNTLSQLVHILVVLLRFLFGCPGVWCTCLSLMQSNYSYSQSTIAENAQSTAECRLWDYYPIIIRLRFFITATAIIALLFVFTLVLGFNIARCRFVLHRHIELKSAQVLRGMKDFFRTYLLSLARSFSLTCFFGDFHSSCVWCSSLKYSPRTRI